jgi:hypothetical protein
LDVQRLFTGKGAIMSRIVYIVCVCLLAGFVTAALAAEPDARGAKAGVIKSVDAKAKTFVLEREPRALTFTVNEKTVITLDGKESTFEAAIKPDLKASVTYTKSGEDRVATKVAVTSKAVK